MSIAAIRSALETHLAALTPALATAYENGKFNPPAATVPYQRVYLLPGTPENPTLGDGYYRQIGIFQISLIYPLKAGPGAAAARAELLRTHFKRGTSMTFGGATVIVRRTPGIAAGFPDNDRYVVPVTIDWYSHTFE